MLYEHLFSAIVQVLFEQARQPSPDILEWPTACSTERKTVKIMRKSNWLYPVHFLAIAGFFFWAGCNPDKDEMLWMQAFICELAHKVKHADAAL